MKRTFKILVYLGLWVAVVCGVCYVALALEKSDSAFKKEEFWEPKSFPKGHVFTNLPPGRSIVCDMSGHYAVRMPGDYVDDYKIQTNYYEAVKYAWRVWEILDGVEKEKLITPPKPVYHWHDCDNNLEAK